MHRRKVLFLSQIPKTRQRVAGVISRVVGRTDDIADDGGRYLLSPEQRRDLALEYRDSNRIVAARYGITDPGSFVGLPDPEPDWFAPEPVSRAETAAVFRRTITECWREFPPARAAKLSLQIAGVFAALPWRGTGSAPPRRNLPVQPRDA